MPFVSNPNDCPDRQGEAPEERVHDYEFDRNCAAKVCYYCGDHKGLVRCYCGWSKSGNNGARELVEMGENLDYDY